MKSWLLSFLFLFVTGSLCRAQNPILYGMTSGGGADSAGVIFSYDVTTGIENVLHVFGNSTDGKAPGGSLIQANNGLLYGMTQLGGDSDSGTIFSYDIITGKETDIHDFGTGIEGKKPWGSLIQANNGLLYGMTQHGGSNGEGIIFCYNITTGIETVLHNFGSTSYDGGGPNGSLLLVNDSLLYGTTQFGGVYTFGTIFSYNISTIIETVLHDYGGFTGNDGWNPGGSLIQANDSLFYGTTWSGNGANFAGTIFNYNSTIGKETVLISFSGSNGWNTSSSFIQASNGLLYGMTFSGGNNNDSGTIFSYNISTDTEIVIHSFTGTDGAFPYGDLLEVDSPATGINQLSSTNTPLSIYPNPTSGQFTIKLNGNQNGYTVEVYNVVGEKMLYCPLTPEGGTPLQIDLSKFAAGMYFVYLKSEERVEVGKVLVTK